VHDPANAAGAKDLLGDRSNRVAAQHYNLANGVEASRAMAFLIGDLKGKGSQYAKARSFFSISDRDVPGE
jgi:hypothetical protein